MKTNVARLSWHTNCFWKAEAYWVFALFLEFLFNLSQGCYRFLIGKKKLEKLVVLLQLFEFLLVFCGVDRLRIF